MTQTERRVLGMDRQSVTNLLIILCMVVTLAASTVGAQFVMVLATGVAVGIVARMVAEPRSD